MLIDCFLFFNELDLLEIRLNALAPHVDKFVLCETPQTHSGNAKPLWFEEHKDRFKDFPIRHLIAPALKKYKYKKEGDIAWEREHYQREYLMNGIWDARPQDMVLLSDVDEIPNLEIFDDKEGAFKQKLYYYYFNAFTNTRRWKGTIATRRENTREIQDIRNQRNKTQPLPGDGGWHFSTMGTPDQIIYKIESFAHCELNLPKYKDNIAANRKDLKDPYSRTPHNWKNYPEYKFSIEMPSGPKWLLENKSRYPHLFYHEPPKAA